MEIDGIIAPNVAGVVIKPAFIVVVKARNTFNMIKSMCVTRGCAVKHRKMPIIKSS
jgi:hypothetical protein